MRVSGKSLLKVSAGVSTTSNVGPASSWNALIAMGVLEHAHPAVSAEVHRERAQGWYMAVCRSCVRLCTELLVTTPLFPRTLLRSVINSGVPTQAEYVTVGHQCTGMWFLSMTLIFTGDGR